MKKILFFAVAVVMLSACGGRKAPQDGGHGIGINSATIAQNNSDDDYVPQRSDYSFRTEVRTVKEDDEVEIIRYKWKDGKLVESEREQMPYSDLAEDGDE